MALVDFKGYFQGQKGPIWTLVIYVSQYLRNGACCDQCLYEAHIICKVIYGLSVDLVNFDLGLPLKVKSRLHTFKELCLINGALYDQSLYEIHISSHMAFQFTLWHLTFDEIERANQGHWVFSGYACIS